MVNTTTGTASRDYICLHAWNRDVAAVPNFRHILYGLRENQKKKKKTRTMFALKQYNLFGRFKEKKAFSWMTVVYILKKVFFLYS